ncbi:MAG: hypothetical protein U0Q15_13905 [Kineosporiaceae bacterium]
MHLAVSGQRGENAHGGVREPGGPEDAEAGGQVDGRGVGRQQLEVVGQAQGGVRLPDGRLDGAPQVRLPGQVLRQRQAGAVGVRGSSGGAEP